MAEPADWVRIAIIGDLGVGGTSIWQQFRRHFDSHWCEYDPTLEDIRCVVEIDGKPCVLDVFDASALQEEYEAMRELWMRESETFLLVYSTTSRSSFSSAKKLHDGILAFKGSPVPVVLVGNKTDLDTEREVSTQEGAKLAEELGCLFVETSAKLGLNVERPFFDLARAMRQTRLGGPSQPAAPNRQTACKPADPKPWAPERRWGWKSVVGHLCRFPGLRKTSRVDDSSLYRQRKEHLDAKR